MVNFEVSSANFFIITIIFSDLYHFYYHEDFTKFSLFSNVHTRLMKNRRKTTHTRTQQEEKSYTVKINRELNEENRSIVFQLACIESSRQATTAIQEWTKK